MIFNTTTQDLSSAITNASGFNNQLAIMGVSLEDIFAAVNVNGGFKGLSNIFSNVLTKTDEDLLKRYNEELDKGTDYTDAYAMHLTGASKACKSQALAANGAKVDTDGLNFAMKGSTASMIGARIAATALQTVLSMGLALAIQAVITGLDYLIHLEENLYESAKEQAEVSKMKGRIK